jgi:hypothetical protein
MNYKNKDMLCNVENITIKYPNLSCADATKPVRQKLSNLLLWNKDKGIKKMPEDTFSFIYIGRQTAELLSSEDKEMSTVASSVSWTNHYC